MKSLHILTFTLVLAGATPARADTPPKTPNLIFDISANVVAKAVRSIDQTRPVCEVILDTPVTGMSRTLGGVHLELVPDPCHAALDVVVDATSFADTVSQKSGFTIYTSSVTPLQLRRRILVDAENFVVVPGPTQARAFTTLRNIVDMNGECDTALTRFARCTFFQSLPDAQFESAAKTSWQANDQLSSDLHEGLGEISLALQGRLAGLGTVGMRVEDLRFATTPAEIETSLRIATKKAITSLPPTLPPASDIGLRLHETLLNETARAMLGGKTFRMDAVTSGYEAVAKLLLKDPRNAASKAESAKMLAKLMEVFVGKTPRISFVKDEPVVVHFTPDGFTIDINVASLGLDNDTLEGSRINARYRIVNEGGEVQAIRQGKIRFAAPGEPTKLKPASAPLELLFEDILGGILQERVLLADLALPGSEIAFVPLLAGSGDGWLYVAWRLR